MLLNNLQRTIASVFLQPFESNSYFGQPHIRFAVREKRRDAKSALKNILLNGSPYQVTVPHFPNLHFLIPKLVSQEYHKLIQLPDFIPFSMCYHGRNVLSC